MYKQLFISTAIALSTLQAATSALANTTSPAAVQPPQKIIQQNIQQEAWLGIGLGTIPSILRSQLASVIPSGQGVMITAVSNNSPAAKAGLKQHDVILNSGDQKIYSPQQLTGLVKANPPGSTLNLSIVRSGKAQEVSVILGKRDQPTTPYWQHQPSFFTTPFGRGWQMPAFPQLQAPAIQGNKQAMTSWDSFESVQVKTLPDGRYHAEVKYKDTQNNEKSFTFEGKRDEIIKQIKAQKELADDKREALLNALHMSPQSLFNRQPFFQGQNLFNDPFFQQGFPSFFGKQSRPIEPFLQGEVL